MLRRFTAVIVFCMMIAGAFSVSAEMSSGASRIMVLPFDGTSSGNFSYLTDSIRAMISSRLGSKEGIEIVDYSVNAEAINLLLQGGNLPEDETFFKKFNTDYVVTGALYALQTGLKIQVSLRGSSLVDVEGKFSALAVNESEILQSVEGLVQDITAKGLGVKTSDIVAVTGGTDASKSVSGFSTEHPEKIFKKGVYGGSIVAEGGAAVQALGVRRSSPIPTMMVAMATGDVDGDGSLEIIAASRTSIEIFQFDDTRFRKLAEHKIGVQYKINAVSIADLNNDGLMEIVISGNEGEKAISAIYNYRSSAGLSQIAKVNGWYLRPVTKPGDGLMLAGQKGSKSGVDGYVRGSVAKMAFDSDFKNIREDKKLGLPRNIRLFDFIWADLAGDGTVELVAIDNREKLLVYDSSNNLIWVSEDDFGGSRNFFGPTKSSVKSNRDLSGGTTEADFDRVTTFIPTRLIAVDLDGDNAQEIIIGRNARQWSKWISETREYDGGSIACLSWKDDVMQEMWHTNKINGYIADYSLNQTVDNNDSIQLYVAQIPDKVLFGLVFNKESKLLRYELGVEGVK